MLFSFHCPACKGKLEADASLSGSQSPCPHCAALVAIPEPRVAAGTTLAGFRLERRLGKGGMGEVYLARQLSVERQVAVKILPPGFAENPDAVRRFLHEGKLAARLDHFNIVTVFEAGEDSGNYYLAMAYIEGESLDQRLRRDRVVPEAEALAIIRTMADALAYAWDEFKLLHRDLKPANIMVDRRGRVFLMDLGLAKSVGEESGMTLSGSVIGTPQYMSPEQAQGLADLGVPTDVYALGATLYHIVTGAPPFTGETMLTVLHKHMYEPLPPPRSRNPELTEACSHLIEAMMAKQPAARYGDWRALVADIDRVLQGAPPSRHPLEPAVRTGAAGASAVSPVPRQSAGVLLDGRRPRAPERDPLEPAVRTGSAGAAAVPPAVSKAALARQAQQALARQQQPPPKPTAAPVSAKRAPWLPIGLAAAVVVLLALVGALVAAHRGRSAAGRPNGTDGTGRTEGPDATRLAASAESAASAAPIPPSTKLAANPTAPSAPPATGQPWTVPDLGLELVWVAPGSFQMGSNDGEPQAKPVHEVRISRGYWIGKYEVTQAEYEALMGANPSNAKGARNPVEMVLWTDATAFCARLTEREQKAGRLPQGYGYRLPTDAEWEYAAQGGTGSGGYTYAGSNNVDEVAWHFGNSGDRRLDDSQWGASIAVRNNNCRPHPVGQKKPNELGLFDMSGNVWEWCLDWYDDTYYAKSPGTDPVNLLATTMQHVCRGGSSRYLSSLCARSAWRSSSGQDAPGICQGFRASLGPRIEGLSGDTAPVLPSVKAEPAKSATTAAPAAPPALGQPWTVPDLGLELIWVAPGSFQMGSNDGKDDEKPVHAVRISRGYWIGKHVVTQAEYEALTGTNPSKLRGARNPADQVSLSDSVAFCTKLTEREQKTGRLPQGYEYRLPTEAEWEYAARGGAGSKGYTYAGSNNANEVAWYYGNSGDRPLDDSETDVDKRGSNTSSNNCWVHPVGQKKPNELGLYDLSGNVWEWCVDWYDGGYYAKSPGTDPVNLHAVGGRVVRGGAWDGGAWVLRSANRRGIWAHGAGADLGFRACLAPTIPAAAP